MADLLLAASEPGIVKTLHDALKGAGHDVDLAADGDSAIKLIAKKRYAALVIDANLSQKDDRHLVRALRSAYGHIPPIIVVVGPGPLSPNVAAAGASALRPAAVFVAPVDIPDFLDALARAVQPGPVT